MKKHFIGLTCILAILSTATISWRPANAKISATELKKSSPASELLEKFVSNIYESAHLQESGLTFDLFKKGITGYLNFKAADMLPQNSAMLTIVDFTKSSREKRMWIIDLLNKQLTLNTLVAHGQGSGTEMASSFSDREDSHMSSVGFYLTDVVYHGKHGRSLKLDGMDEGFNSSARAREIVVHAAPYVSEGTIEHLGYLGRSFGCPAVSPAVVDQVINTIKNRTVLFINGNEPDYTSKYLDEQQAANFLSNSGVAYLASM